MNPELIGVLEWIVLQGGTCREFNEHIVCGRVRGLVYRYFITEGWIGLKTHDAPRGQSLKCTNLDEFVDAVGYELELRNELDRDAP